MGGNQTTQAWEVVKSQKKETRCRAIVSTVGMGEWKRHYKEMLTENRDEFVGEARLLDDRDQREEMVSGITKEEIYRSIRQTKNGKSPGPGNIPRELIKNSPE